MAKITADIQYDQAADALNIYWHYNGYARGHYFVEWGVVKERAEQVRKALQDLVDGYCAGSQSKYQELLQEVARRGHDLYDALFAGLEPQDRDVATRIKSWLGSGTVTSDDDVVFNVPAKIHIPWGLVYDAPTPEDAAFAVEKEGFWCIKHKLVTKYMYLAAEGVEIEWSPDKFDLLLGAHETVWTAAFPLLREEEHGVLARLVASATPKFSRKDMLGQWRERRSSAPYGILGFFCHASGTALCIGNETISDASFREEFKRDDMSGQPPTLVFLAGCQTAIGDLSPGFLGATSGTGFCGLIGTEVKTPDVFTLGFLASFLARFYEGGGCVADIMKELRERHWPLSLVFSVCCAGDLRLRASSASVPAASGAPRNLSEHKLVSR